MEFFNGTLYGIFGSSLVSINVTTGAATVLSAGVLPTGLNSLATHTITRTVTTRSNFVIRAEDVEGVIDSRQTQEAEIRSLPRWSDNLLTGTITSGPNRNDAITSGIAGENIRNIPELEGAQFIFVSLRSNHPVPSTSTTSAQSTGIIDVSTIHIYPGGQVSNTRYRVAPIEGTTFIFNSTTQIALVTRRFNSEVNDVVGIYVYK